ncbi:MAG: CapA family protein [Anaerolineae bacterium]
MALSKRVAERRLRLAAGLVLVTLGSAMAATPVAADEAGGPGNLASARGCTAEHGRVRVTAAFVGDVLAHDTLQTAADQNRARGGFATLWSQVAPALALPHVTYANLEGPVAENVRCDGRLSGMAPSVLSGGSACGPGDWSAVYTGYPLLNYPPRLLDDLRRAGVDVVSTANNHALDRYALGVDLTLDALDSRGIAHFGTRRAGSAEPFYTVTPVRGEGGTMQIAWLACSFGTNGIPDRSHQVASCYEASGLPSDDLVRAVGYLSGRDDVDAVVVTPHWGVEYSRAPSESQRRLAQRLVDAGALAVVGTHPHVLQPMERLTASGANGRREAFVAYSLGNFIADQPVEASRVGAVLLLHLATSNGRSRIEGVDVVPYRMVHGPPGSGLALTLVPLPTSAAASVERMLPSVSLITPADAMRGDSPPCSDRQRLPANEAASPNGERGGRPPRIDARAPPHLSRGALRQRERYSSSSGLA